MAATGLRGAEERFLIDDHALTAEQLRAEAVRLVRAHAARLGMDAFAADVLARAIGALPAAITR